MKHVPSLDRPGMYCGRNGPTWLIPLCMTTKPLTRRPDSAYLDHRPLYAVPPNGEHIERFTPERKLGRRDHWVCGYRTGQL